MQVVVCTHAILINLGYCKTLLFGCLKSWRLHVPIKVGMLLIFAPFNFVDLFSSQNS